MRGAKQVGAALLSVWLLLQSVHVASAAASEPDAARLSGPVSIGVSIGYSPVRVSAAGYEAPEQRTKSEIIARAEELNWPAQGNGEPVAYQTEPTFPRKDGGTDYRAGAFTDYVNQNALELVNLIRYAAGLAGEVKAGEDEEAYAQSATVLFAEQGGLERDPLRLDQMNRSFYNRALKGAQNSLLADSGNNLTGVLRELMAGKEQLPEGLLEARRRLLDPDVETIGFGMSSDPVDQTPYYAVYLPADGLTGGQYDYIPWPNAGDNPAELFSGPWSIFLSGSFQTDAEAMSRLKVTLTRTRDQKSWSFSGDSLTVSASDSGQQACISFAPDPASLGNGGIYLDGDTFEVELSGLKDTAGTDAVIGYRSSFFYLYGQPEPETLQLSILTEGNGTARGAGEYQLGEDATLLATAARDISLPAGIWMGSCTPPKGSWPTALRMMSPLWQSSAMWVTVPSA